MRQNLFDALNSLIETNKNVDFDESLNENILKSLKILSLSFDNVSDSVFLNQIEIIVSESDSIQWKFIGMASFVLISLKESIVNETEYMMSVSCQKNIKSALQFIVSMGILPNLIPGVGVPFEKRSEFAKYFKKENVQVLEKYHRLTGLCNLLSELCHISDIKTIVFSNFLGDYLALLFQLCYAPIMKPDSKSAKKSLDFVMSEAIYNQFMLDQQTYKAILDSILSKTYRPMIMKELIILQGGKNPEPPIFMKKHLSKEMSNILLSDDGILCVMRCFFDDDNIDIGNQWKQIDIIKRLISVKHGLLTIDDYLKNICSQFKTLILTCKKKDFVIVSAACVAHLYEKYPDNSIILDIIDSVTQPFLLKVDENSTIGPLIMSVDEVSKTLNILDLCFNTPKLCLPLKFLTPIIHFIFCLGVFCPDGTLKIQIQTLILKYLQSKSCSTERMLNTILFLENNEDLIISKNIIFEKKSDGIQVSYSINRFNVTTEQSLNYLLEMINEKNVKFDLSVSVYVYCLEKVLTLSSKRVDSNSKEFLILEDETYDLINKDSENMLILLKALEKLSCMDSVLNSFKENPSLIVKFIAKFLDNYIKSMDSKNENFNNECVIICLTLLTVLLSTDNDNEILKLTLEPIKSSLKVIINKTSNQTIVFLCEEISNSLKENGNFNTSKTKSEFEKAVSEICDPLLPVRAHGLMQLIKLIEEKDSETISKKHYVQCIFEQNLKNDDSYIYLTAINGLAAMVNLSAEEVLEVLTREFLDDKSESNDLTIDKNECIQTRMKIGEILVKATKTLGDMAGNHRNLLINTFLVGCKDKDDFLRASSLSNLAEVCKVLSYKLGSILYEMLNCIDSILQTDKSPECRRASVLVVSSLLKGLGREALHFLREALLPIYRTLKKLYNNEAEDPTVRLHAQIGLEELDSIARGVLFAPLKMEKQIFLINQPNNL